MTERLIDPRRFVRHDSVQSGINRRMAVTAEARIEVNLVIFSLERSPAKTGFATTADLADH